MIESVPNTTIGLFLFSAVLSIVFFHYANGKPKKITAFLILWSVLHGILAFTGFYQDMSSLPPRFALILAPATLLIIYGTIKPKKSWILEKRNYAISHFLHIVRIPVEMCLYTLFLHGYVPELMTFAGRNFDIVMGVTAVIVAGLILRDNIPLKALFAWNLIGLFMVCFILVNGILSAPFPFQQFGFDQPNTGISYFPFVLLPALIVPLVIWTHLIDMRGIYLRLKEKA